MLFAEMNLCPSILSPEGDCLVYKYSSPSHSMLTSADPSMTVISGDWQPAYEDNRSGRMMVVEPGERYTRYEQKFPTGALSPRRGIPTLKDWQFSNSSFPFVSWRSSGPTEHQA